MAQPKKEEKQLICEIEARQDSGELSFAKLRTDERVLARITDGIYRQPSSALRELISNAYDADATTVVIQTDAPRFQQITVRDDGNGMDVASLARLIHHIGGSTKRRKEGADYNTTSSDPTRSPSGRRLIGKIGIGLFSVAQLTRHFQIVTKVAGSKHRLVAEVVLNNYTEDGKISHGVSDDDDTVESGDVAIRSVPADDEHTHGTEIILMDLRPQSIDLLRSKDVWDYVNRTEPDDQGIMLAQKVPSFHIGLLDPTGERYVVQPHVPWSSADPPSARFEKLFQGIVDEIGVSTSDPKLESSLDNYFRAIWNLSLAAPIDYLEEHPFNLGVTDEPTLYELIPNAPGQAKALDLRLGETVRSKLEMKSPERGPSTPEFKVIVDDVELKRPIRFSDFPASKQAMKNPLLFAGKARPDLSKIPEEERGGDLEFEAYFLWSPKVVPKENSGLLIRIGDASGTLFDETFAKYQVSEQNRLRQITAEIFILRGLDPALNIDRESFNYSHPHYQYISRWTHKALRQVVNTLKSLGEQVSSKAKEAANIAKVEKIKEVAAEAIELAVGAGAEELPCVEITNSDQRQLVTARNEGRLALNAQKVFAPAKFARGRKAERENEIFRQQIVAVAQVLQAYGLFEGLTYEQQEELLRSIVAIFRIDGK